MLKELLASYVTPLFPLPTSVEPENNLRAPVFSVIFDVYGTLFISESGDIGSVEKDQHQTSAIDFLLKKYDISLNYKQLRDLLARAIASEHAGLKEKGIDFPEIKIEQIFMRILRLKDIEAARRFSAEYEMIVNPVYPMPHLSETLRHIKDNNILMGIISNAQFITPHLFDLFCRDFPEQLGFDPELIFYSYQYGIAKPSLFMFKQAAEQLTQKGFRSENVLYVGNDMLNDIYPAHSIGFQTCLFAGDSRSLRLRQDRSECTSLKPDAIITDLIQLIGIQKV